VARFFLADLRTGRQILDLPVMKGSWSVPLNAPGTVQATCNLEDPDTRALALWNTTAPGKTVLAVEEQGIIMEAGPIWTRQWDQDASTLSIAAKGIWSCFDQRFIEQLVAATISTTQFTVPDPADVGGTKTIPNPALQTKFSGLDLGSIGRQLVNLAMSWTGGSLPIVLPATVPGGHERIWEGAEFKKVGEELRSLTQVENGPDIRFQPRFTADLLGVEWLYMAGTQERPLLYSDQVQTWDLTAPESAITNLSVDEDASSIASLAWATGGRANDTVLVSRAYDESLVASGYPLWEVLDSSHSNVIEQPTLDAYAADAVVYGHGPIQVWSFHAEITGQPSFGSYGVGDYVDLFIGDRDMQAYLPPGRYRQRIISMAGDEVGQVVSIACAAGR
jgi:hypothetical protein